MNGISEVIRKDTREIASSSCSLPCEDTARRQPSANQEVGPQQTPDPPAS